MLRNLLLQYRGPLVNLLIIGIVLFLDMDGSLKEKIVYSNLLVCIFNLLPIYPLDGGRMIKSMLSFSFEKMEVEKMINFISNFAVIVATAMSSILIVYMRNVAIFFAIVYLWVVLIRENKRFAMKMKVHEIINKSDDNVLQRRGRYVTMRFVPYSY